MFSILFRHPYFFRGNNNHTFLSTVKVLAIRFLPRYPNYL
nr:MAG TPA: hypothetical protein [Caudoviricetes sp.]